MDPEDLGIPSSKLVLGKHSGRHALRDRMEQLGHNLSDDQLDRVFDEFKVLADRKKEIFDEDLEAIVGQLFQSAGEQVTWELVNLQTSGGTSMIETATVGLKHVETGETRIDAAIGDGPIDAAYTCIMRITGIEAVLKEYDLRAITGGRDAQGEVHLELVSSGRSFRGRGRSTDVIEASVRAYMSALNRAIAASKRPVQEVTNGDV
jgi:2-isopropylmalate synthase